MQNTALNRCQIYLTVAQQKTLASMAHTQSSSSSALIREAIDSYIQTRQPGYKLAIRRAVAGSWQPPQENAPTLRELRQEERSF